MVYVVQEQAGKNLMPAEKWGKLAVLLPEQAQACYSPGEMAKRLVAKLASFNDGDWLLLIGDPVFIGVASAAAMAANKGRAGFLKWDRQEKEYLPVKVDIKEAYGTGGRDGDGREAEGF